MSIAGLSASSTTADVRSAPASIRSFTPSPDAVAAQFAPVAAIRPTGGGDRSVGLDLADAASARRAAARRTDASQDEGGASQGKSGFSFRDLLAPARGVLSGFSFTGFIAQFLSQTDSAAAASSQPSTAALQAGAGAYAKAGQAAAMFEEGGSEILDALPRLPSGRAVDLTV